jgi:ABC-type oligopeptide transport system substrate-binding subunit
MKTITGTENGRIRITALAAVLLVGLLSLITAAAPVSGLVMIGHALQIPYGASSSINTPANLTATAVSPSQIRLTWKDMSDNEIRFRIERRTGKAAYFTVNLVGSNVTEYLDTRLNPGTTYYYRVIASGLGGDSAPSNEAMGNTMGPPAEIPILTAPGNYSIIDTEIPRLLWNPAENATTYSFQISRDYNFTNLLVDESGIQKTYYQVPENMLKRYLGYYWRVSASNAAGRTSDWSPIRRFVIFPWLQYYHGGSCCH